MVLDKHRFQLWVDAQKEMPQDIKDTIESLMDFEDCDEVLKEQAKEIEKLKKEIEDLKSLKSTKVPPTVPRTILSRYEAQGNSFPVKETLKRFGFRWDGDGKIWYLKDEGDYTEKKVKEARAALKDICDDVEIVYLKGS